MRRLVLIEFLSLDGVIQGLAGPEDGFPHGGWGLDYPVDVQQQPDAPVFAGTSAYLFGRRTFEQMAAYWPNQPDANPMAAHLNATQKYLVSRTVQDPKWQPTTVIADDVAGTVATLKAEGEGTIAVLGSGALAGFLLAEGLVDGLSLFVHPLLLGTGARLFGDLPEPRRLRLESCTTSELGSLVLNYTFEPPH